MRDCVGGCGGAIGDDGHPLKVKISGDLVTFSDAMRKARAATPALHRSIRRPWYRRRLRWV
jgi:hypothetical protein